MWIEVLSIGKIRENFVVEGTRYYTDKLKHFCNIELTELVLKEAVQDPIALVHAESDLLIKRLKPKHLLVLLDQRGLSPDSPEWAHKLQKWEDQGQHRLQIVVGGAYGVDQVLRDKADWVWSLSPLTFPHPLVRLILFEQLYRAMCINHRIPYHHG